MEGRLSLLPRTSKLNMSLKEQISKRQTLTGDSSIRQDIYRIIKHLNQKHVLNNYKSLSKLEKEQLQGIK
jgi:recombinational DNA repair protein (RecF pathway)